MLVFPTYGDAYTAGQVFFFATGQTALAQALHPPNCERRLKVTQNSLGILSHSLW